MLLDSNQFAEVAGISERKARLALQRAVDGRTWRGAELDVIQVRGKGGKSGKQYMVAVDSLPLDIQERLRGPQELVEVPSKVLNTEGTAQFTRWFVRVFADVLATPSEKRHPDRVAAFKALIGTTVTDWNGNELTIAHTTAYRWVKEYEAQGMAAFAKSQRSDKGKKRVHFTERFDNFMRQHGVGDDKLAVIAQSAHDYIASLVQQGKKPKVSRVLGSEHLMKLARMAGVQSTSDQQLRHYCRIDPRYFSNRDLRTRKRTYTHTKDRKKSYDRQPRVQRIAPSRPMEVVVMDVHHVNVLIARPDGTTATPKCLAIMDLATQRVWCDWVLPAKGGGIRQEHIAYSTSAMFAHEDWGVPEAIYIDNGSEYAFMDVLEDALKLNSRNIACGRGNLVIKALPYNAAAKPVEAWFGHFEQQFMRGCQGYIGDDRMKAEVEQLGKLPAPFGTFEQFVAYANKQLEAYHLMPQEGHLQGLSPMEALQKHLRAKWSATVADQSEILSVITKPIKRRVRQGTISLHNEQFFADALCDARWNDETVLVHVPRALQFDALRVTDLDGNDIALAYRDRAFGYADPAGAKESARRKAIYNASFKRIQKSVPKVDVDAEIIEFVARKQAEAPLRRNKPAGRISVNPIVHQDPAALGYSPKIESAQERYEREEAESIQREADKAAIEEIWKMIEANNPQVEK